MDRTHRTLSPPVRANFPNWLGLYSTLRQWQRNRHTRQHLALLNDQQLADAGISADQRDQELTKPFWR